MTEKNTKPWDKFARFWKRTPDDIVLNIPTMVTIGGSRKGVPLKQIEIREPSNKRFASHAKMLVNAAQAVVVKNYDWIREVQSDPSQITATDVIDRFKPVIPALTGFLADITDTDTDFIENDMSPKQTSLVLMAYVRAVGMDVIRDVFMSAVIQWRAMAATINAPTPATTLGPQPTPGPFPESAE